MTLVQTKCPGSMPQRGRRHTVAAVTRARQLASAECWSLREIAEILTSEGYTESPPHAATIRIWTKPDVARRNAEQKQAFNQKASEQARLERMQRYRNAGVSYAAIARVLNVDFGAGLTEDQVRYALVTGRYPKTKKNAPAPLTTARGTDTGRNLR